MREGRFVGCFAFEGVLMFGDVDLIWEIERLGRWSFGDERVFFCEEEYWIEKMRIEESLALLFAKSRNGFFGGGERV